MQAPTHLLTGKLIQAVVGRGRSFRGQRLLEGSLAVVSHGILDRLARLTYHPAVALPKDGFWVSYHLIIAMLTVYILRKDWKNYKTGMLLATLPDMDWLVLHLSGALAIQIPWWNEPKLHRSLWSITASLPLLKYLDSLPDWTQRRKGAILELTLIALLVSLNRAMTENCNRDPESQASDKEMVVPEPGYEAPRR